MIASVLVPLSQWWSNLLAWAVALGVGLLVAAGATWRRTRMLRRRKQETQQQATWEDITAATPGNVDEALVAMRRALLFFHGTSDHRAIFLRAYYIITRNVQRAIRLQEAGVHATFFDPDWVSKLSGRFASLYFLSLPSAPRTASRIPAWQEAHGSGPRTTRPVSMDLLLGINAHINFDLPVALYQNINMHNDTASFLQMMRRKFDHDQVNGILLQSLPEIQDVLSREYGGAMRLLRRILLTYDRAMVGAGLSYYRERVWWHATSFTATADESEIRILTDRLMWETGTVAKRILGVDQFWARLYLGVEAFTRRRTLEAITLEELPPPVVTNS